MDLSNLNSLLEPSSELNDQRQDFIDGLFKLAFHWRGEDGVQEIKSRMFDLIAKGASTEEAAVEAYQYLRPKIL